MIHRSYAELNNRLDAIASSPSITKESFGDFEADGRIYSIFMMQMGTPGKQRVLIASGIHGDEPASVEAVLNFMETNAGNYDLLSRFHFTIFPCNNPTGWEMNTRENWQGIDLNRQFAARHPAPEVDLIMRTLQGRCFDLVFEMHEDVDAPGFYLYEIADDPKDHIAEKIVEAVESMGYPVNYNSTIEGMSAQGGIIRRSVNIKRFRKTRVPQAIYIYRTCGGHVITLEPPASMLSLEDRVRIELTALQIALDSVAR